MKIKNLEVFQGKKYLTNLKTYFEGWYFKQVNEKNSLAIIPGINIKEKNPKAFIQIITNTSSYFVHYSIKDFHYQQNPFCIRIKDNIFTKEKMILSIEDKTQHFNMKGCIHYSNLEMIQQTFMKPNIMGPFSYLPFLECNHAILTMKNSTSGIITINNQIMNFDHGVGYIEKDWGCSFPKKYLWCQGNLFTDKNASFMLAIADVPFRIFTLKGLICSLKIGKQEYLFSTYNFAKIKRYEISKDQITIVLKKGKYTIKIEIYDQQNQTLLAPQKGKMNQKIEESITATMKITLKKKKEIIFEDLSIGCGVELVK